jgi:hypothetical protein
MFSRAVDNDSSFADASDEALKQDRKLEKKKREEAITLVQARVLKNVTTAHTLINSSSGGIYCPRRYKNTDT